MKTGTWDTNENLPKEYKNIYSFENLKYTYKLAVRTAHEEGMKISGSYVKITIKAFVKNELKYFSREIPIIASTLLLHERKLCVMHFKVNLNYEFDEKIYNKQVLEGQYGFRRNLMRPIYCSEIGVNSDKLKIEKFLEKDKFYIASVYAQLIYPFSPVLFFKPKLNSSSLNDIGRLKLALSGHVHTSDSKKVILKKIVLTGYPIKIKKRKVVVRYMFFNPNDIHYFKPVQLSTKNGLRGHITESLGTHGYMKCVFSDHMKSSDTICMNLFRRIFPICFKETWKYKIGYGHKKDYLNYFTLDMEKFIMKYKTRDDLDKEKKEIELINNSNNNTNNNMNIDF
jgi:pre-rRNA-processing protein TSR1